MGQQPTLHTFADTQATPHCEARKNVSRLELLQQYRSVRRQGTMMNRRLKSEYFINQFQEHRHNPKAQWNMINTLSGRIKPRTEAKAPLSELAKTFTSVVTDSSRPQQLPFVLFRVTPCWNICSTSILGKPQDLTTYHQSSLIKGCAPALSGPLTGIINESLSTGVVPDVFKLARVCPLFKVGDHKNPSWGAYHSFMQMISRFILLVDQWTSFVRFYHQIWETWMSICVSVPCY